VYECENHYISPTSESLNHVFEHERTPTLATSLGRPWHFSSHPNSSFCPFWGKQSDKVGLWWRSVLEQPRIKHPTGGKDDVSPEPVRVRLLKNGDHLGALVSPSATVIFQFVWQSLLLGNTKHHGACLTVGLVAHGHCQFRRLNQASPWSSFSSPSRPYTHHKFPNLACRQ